MNTYTSAKAPEPTTPRVVRRVASRLLSPRLRCHGIALALLVIALVVVPARAGAASDLHLSDWASAGPKWIEVNLSEQWLTAYQGSTPVFGAAVSTGAYPYYTPAGEFTIVWKQEWETMVGYDYYLPDVPYVMYFADYLAIHGTYWHDNFGYPMSHGCVNLPIWAAEWLYYWAPIGTGIWIHY